MNKELIVQTPSVLIVDDEPIEVARLHEALLQSDFIVREANTVSAAFHLIDSIGFDLVILDREIRVGSELNDGIDICRQLRQNGFSGRIVFYTNLNSPTEHRRGWGAGADDYIEKSWPTDTVLARCQAHLNRSNLPSTDATGAASAVVYFSGRLPEGRALVVDGHALTVSRREDFNLIRRGLANKLKLTDQDREKYRSAKLTDLDTAVFFHLLNADGEWVSEEELLKEVWAFSELRLNAMRNDPDANTGLVHTTIGRIRRKIDTKITSDSTATRSFDRRGGWEFIRTNDSSEASSVNYRFAMEEFDQETVTIDALEQPS